MAMEGVFKEVYGQENNKASKDKKEKAGVDEKKRMNKNFKKRVTKKPIGHNNCSNLSLVRSEG